MKTWSVVSAFVLIGCQSAAFHTPALDLPAHWHAARDSREPQASNLTLRWESVFPSSELQALIEKALRNNSDLIIAAERIELARIQSGIEDAARLPSLRLDLGSVRQRGPGAHPTDNQISESGRAGLLMPSWEIDLWGRLRDRAEAARRNLLAQTAQADALRLSLIAQVSGRYLDLLDLDHQIQITERTVEARKKSLRLNRLRFEEGISSVLDVHQAESSLAAAEQSLADQRRRQGQTEHALSLLLGEHPGAIQRTSGLMDLPPPAQLTAGLPSDLLIHRPDIRAAEAALAAGEANIAAARKAYLPSVSLTTMLGFVSPALSQLLDGNRFAWSVQPSIGLNLFDGGRTGLAIAQTEAQQRILLEQYKVSIRQAFREVNDQLLAREQLARQREAALRSVHSNQGRFRAANARYLNGIASYLEVLDAERQLLDSELALSQVTRAWHQSVIQLYLALGGQWETSENTERITAAALKTD